MASLEKVRVKQNTRPSHWLPGQADAQGLPGHGGQGQNRTADTGIFSPLLYRLSYLAIQVSRKRRI